MTHSSVHTQAPWLPVDCKHAMWAGEFTTCPSKTRAAPAWAEREPPLAIDAVKSFSPRPSKGRSFPKQAVSIPG